MGAFGQTSQRPLGNTITAVVVDRASGGAHFISKVLVIAIVVLNAVNIIGRYALGQPLEWADETLIQMMIVSVFLAYPRVTLDGAHLRMDVLVAKLSAKSRRLIEVSGDLLCLGLAVTMVVATAPGIVTLIAFDQRSTGNDFPLAIPQSSVPVGFALAALALLFRIYRDLGRSASASAQ